MGAKLRMAKIRISMLEKYGKSRNITIDRLKKRLLEVKERLHYAEKSRNALARVVDPLAVARIHVLTDRNLKLELAVVLARQAAKLLKDSWTRQGYPTDMVDVFEQDLKRLLGDEDGAVTARDRDDVQD